MILKKALLLFGAVLACVSFTASSAQAQYLTIAVGGPVYRPLPYYLPYARPYYPYRYRAYVPVPVAPLRVYVGLPPVYYPQPAPVMQTQYYGYPAPSTAQPSMSASPIPDTAPTVIPPPPSPQSMRPAMPTPPTAPLTPPMLPPPPSAIPPAPAASPLPPPAPVAPPLAPPTPQALPAPPDQTTGIEL